MKFEVPFTRQYNTRLASTYPGAKDERYIDCFWTKEGGKWYLQKMPGWGVTSTPNSGKVGSAINIWTGYGSGSTVYLLSAFTVSSNSTIYVGTTSMGSITGVARSFTEVGGVGTDSLVLIASSDSTSWILKGDAAANVGTLTFTASMNNAVTLTSVSSTTGLVVGQAVSGAGVAAGSRIASIVSSSEITLTLATTGGAASGVTITRETLAKVIDADYPGASLTTVGDFVNIAGYNCILTQTGRLYASDVDTPYSWTSNSYGSTDIHPDYGVGLVTFKTYILAFGANSCEVWYNDGLSPFPLRRNETMGFRIGAVSADAIAKLSDTVFWCGNTEKGGLSIFKYDGNPSRISTPDIDFQLGISGASTISLTTFRSVGRSFVVVNTTSASYLYCIEDNFWFERSGTQLSYKATGAAVTSSNLAYAISAGTSGKIFSITPSGLVWTDNGSAYTSTAISSSQDADGRWMFLNYLRIIADKESATSTLTISYSDDDGANFTSLGTVDLSSMNTRLERLGASQKRIWKLEHASNTGFRIEKLVGEMEVGT